MENVIKTYTELRDSFVKDINQKLGSVYLDNPQELTTLVKFIEYTNSMFEYLIDMIGNYKTIEFNIKGQNSSIERLLETYSVMLPFNEQNARKTLVNGLIKIICDQWFYDGCYFIKGKEMIRYTNIIKKEPVNTNELLSKYQIMKDGIIKKLRE